MFNEMNDSAPADTIDTDQRLHDPLSHISLSSTSRQVEAIKNSLKEVPEINEARVLYFKAEIELGNYQIDADKIAKRMLNLEPAYFVARDSL